MQVELFLGGVRKTRTKLDKLVQNHNSTYDYVILIRPKLRSKSMSFLPKHTFYSLAQVRVSCMSCVWLQLFPIRICSQIVKPFHSFSNISLFRHLRLLWRHCSFLALSLSLSFFNAHFIWWRTLLKWRFILASCSASYTYSAKCQESQGVSFLLYYRRLYRAYRTKISHITICSWIVR